MTNLPQWLYNLYPYDIPDLTSDQEKLPQKNFQGEKRRATGRSLSLDGQTQ